jgi:hypothetical protein
VLGGFSYLDHVGVALSFAVLARENPVPVLVLFL